MLHLVVIPLQLHHVPQLTLLSEFKMNPSFSKLEVLFAKTLIYSNNSLLSFDERIPSYSRFLNAPRSTDFLNSSFEILSTFLKTYFSLSQLIKKTLLILLMPQMMALLLQQGLKVLMGTQMSVST